MIKLSDITKDLHTRYLSLLMGPSHPAMHGTIKMNLTLDHETVIDVDLDPGYLHRGFEKKTTAGTRLSLTPTG